MSLEWVKQKIASTEAAAGRKPESVQLLVVTKNRSASDIRQLYDIGQRMFGESYLSEAIDKIESLKDCDIEWHFIGPIQSNKTKDIAQSFAWVHGVDRKKIAQRLNDQRPSDKGPLNVCIEVNIDNEPNKSGVTAADVLSMAGFIKDLPQLKLRGLMVIPAKTINTEEQSLAFQETRHLLKQLQSAGYEVDTLSMGMSGDFATAIVEGATLVRIGKAVFEEKELEDGP